MLLLCDNFFLMGGSYMSFHFSYYILSIVPFLHLLFYQIKVFDLNNSISCLKAFKSNNLFGLIIFINILIIKNL